MRIVVDSNVMISAVLFRSKICKEVLEEISINHELIMNNFVLYETEWVTEKKFYDLRKTMRSFLYNLNYQYFAVKKQQIHSIKIKIRDSKDKKILGAAIISKCNILITGDKDFYDNSHLNIEVMTPAEFVKRYVDVSLIYQ